MSTPFPSTTESWSQTESLTLLGQSRVPAQRKLEAFPAPPHLEIVTLECLEFTSLCPVTGQPDFGTITIRYAPNLYCVESKSLKLYLQTYRNTGEFAEALASKIAVDIGEALTPEWVEVEFSQSPRGGIGIRALSRWSSDIELYRETK